MVLHLVLRLLLILLGYALATVFSGIGVGTAFYAAEGGADGWFAAVALATVMIGMFASAPALVTAVVGEAFSIRIRLYYIVAACLIGMGLPVFVGMHEWYIALGLVLGVGAGWIYWAVAGQHAGWRLRAEAALRQ